MEESYRGVSSLEHEFFVFKSQTRIQLLSNQFQLFQTLAAVMLAFLAVMFATNRFEISLWFLCSMLFSVVLLFYTLTYVRETIDAHAEGLDEAETALKKEKDKVIEKIDEAIKKNDYGIFEKFVAQRLGNPKKIGEEQSYAGEISMFLFSNSFLFGTLATVSAYGYWINFSKIVIFTFILCFSFLISVTTPNTYITKRISKLLDKSIRKGKNKEPSVDPEGNLSKQ